MGMRDFNDGNGPVPAKRHRNPDGSLGGWVSNTAQVEPSVTVNFHAQVGGSARVSGKVVLGEGASVYGLAQVKGAALLHGPVRVLDDALVVGSAKIVGTVRICGSAQVNGPVELCDEVVVSGKATVDGTTKVSGRVVITDKAKVEGASVISGQVFVGGKAWVTDSILEGKARIASSARVYKSRIGGSAVVKGDADVRESTVNGNARVRGSAHLSNSSALGHTILEGKARVVDNSYLAGSSSVIGNSVVRKTLLHNCTLKDDVRVSQSNLSQAAVYGNSRVHQTQLRGDILVERSSLSNVFGEGAFYFYRSALEQENLYGALPFTLVTCNGPSSVLYGTFRLRGRSVSYLYHIGDTGDPRLRLYPTPDETARDTYEVDELKEFLLPQPAEREGLLEDLLVPESSFREDQTKLRKQFSYDLSLDGASDDAVNLLVLPNARLKRWQKILPQLHPVVQALIMMLSHR